MVSAVVPVVPAVRVQLTLPVANVRAVVVVVRIFGSPLSVGRMLCRERICKRAHTSDSIRLALKAMALKLLRRDRKSVV